MPLKTGLALSGGGFRATLFAVGSLRRLNEAGLLKQMDTITAVSGGAITAGHLLKHWSQLRFDQEGVASNFNSVVSDPLIQFCQSNIDKTYGGLGLISPFHSIAESIESVYRKFFGDVLLRDIDVPDNCPDIVFYGTNYDTGSSVQITTRSLYDYKIGEATNHDIRLAKAVIVSSSFPPFLAPVELNGSHWNWKETQYSYLFDKAHLRHKLLLCDGGLYDNMGIEKLWKTGDKQEYERVFVSDAGAPFKIPYAYEDTFFGKIKNKIKWRKNWGSQFLRMTNIMIDQQRGLRTRQFVHNLIDDECYQGAYWGIDTNIDTYPHVTPLLSYNKDTMALANLPTRLWSFPKGTDKKLINWAYALTDAALRSRYDRNIPPAQHLPFV